MAIQLDPVELTFRRPFTQEVTEVLRLRNPSSSDPIAFKVKTTAPKQYCVRPNSGRIDPGQNVEVQVLLQAMKEDPPLELKCRDKFLVQSVAVPSDLEFKNWSEIESTSKSSIQEKKIRVTYLPAAGQANGAGVATSTPRKSMLSDDQPPAYSSPVSNAATPAHGSSSAPTGPVSSIESRPENAKSLGDAVESVTGSSANGSERSTAAGIGGAAAGAAAATAATVKSVVPTSSDEMKQQLETANAQIMRLKEQLQDQTGLRQRKAGVGSDEHSGSSQATAMQQHAPSGVPVPITAALCLVSFLLAYLLF